jgi:16S rRNA (uracil1498-N3)-methyltransferase
VTYLEWPRRVAALGQFHVDDVDVPVLAKDDDHHLRRVLRANEGEEVVVTNGAGTWALARVAAHGLERASDVHTDPVLPATAIYLTPLKGDRSEWAVAKASELGIARVVPLIAERMVVKFKGETRTKILSRWRRVADEASAQSRRTYDVVFDEPVKVADVPASVAVADFGGSGAWGGLTSVAVGPEGGWASDEWDQGRRRVGLGPTVLRAETAGVIASSLLTFQAGDWGFTLERPQSE